MEKVTAVKPVLSGIAHGLSRQRGASLLEGIAYLGIAAIVVLGAVSLLTNAFGSAKANQTIEEITALRTAVRKLYTGQSYPSDAVATLVTANAVPNTLVIKRGTSVTLANSWAGDVTVAADATGGTFTIKYTNVPQDVCMAVVSGANGWTKITDGTKSVSTFPATAGDATSVCPNSSNTLSFTAT